MDFDRAQDFKTVQLASGILSVKVAAEKVRTALKAARRAHPRTGAELRLFAFEKGSGLRELESL